MIPGTVRYAQGAAALLIHRNFCKGCRICVTDCPEQILVLDTEDVAVLTDAHRCIFCGVCAVRCPDFAIVLERPAAAAATGHVAQGGIRCA